MRVYSQLALTLAMALGVGAGVSDGLAATATVIPGDKIRGHLDLEDSDTFSFAVGSPASLDVKVKLENDLRVLFEMFAPNGAQIEITELLRKPGTARPWLKSVPLTQLGTYRVIISQSAGAGDYRLQLKLRKLKSRDIDMTQLNDMSPPIVVDASQVLFDQQSGFIEAYSVQEAIDRSVAKLLEGDAEVQTGAHDAIAAVDGRVTTVDDSVTTVDGRVTTVDGRVTTTNERIDGLDDRVDDLEIGITPDSTALRVLDTLDTPQTAEGEFTLYNQSLVRGYRVRRHEILSLTVDPGELKAVLVAEVTMTYMPSFPAGTENQSHGFPGSACWLEIGEKEVYLGQIPGRYASVAGGYIHDEFGTVGRPVEDATEFVQVWRVAYTPTAEERTNGFQADLFISALRQELVNPGIEIDGFTLEINEAVIYGN